MTSKVGFDGEAYIQGLEAGDADAHTGNDFSLSDTADRDFKSGYRAGYVNYFADPCDTRHERSTTANYYDR